MAATILGCVPQRQMFPCMYEEMSDSEGLAFEFSSATPDMIIPDVQYAHCIASSSRNAVCSG